MIVRPVQQCLLVLLVALAAFVAEAADVAGLQRGTALSTGNGTVTVTLPQAVDPARAVLFFSTRHDSDRPPGSMLRGRLATSTTVTFDRVSNQTSNIDINWTVVEFASGVNVQRGSFNMSSTTNNVPLSQSVGDVSQAFVLWSKSPGASDPTYSQDDPIGGRVLDSNTLQFSVVSANGNHVVDYQVVEFTNPGQVLVQSGVSQMSNGAAALDVNLATAVNPSSALVLAGYTSNDTGNQISRRMLNSELVDGSTVRFSRERTGIGIQDVIWQVVEFRDGTSVQQGLETFSSGEAVRSVALANTIDPAASVAFSGMQPVGGLNMGSSSYQSNDIPGTGSFTFDLSAGRLDIQRSNASSTSSVGWSVVTFASLSPVLDLRMDELSWSGAPGEVVDSASGFNATALDGADTAGDTPALTGNPGTCRYGVFDGSNDHVLVPDDPALNGTNALTYSAWIYPRTWSGVRQIMAKSVHGGGSGRAQMGIFSESGQFTLRAETSAGRRDLRVTLPALDAWSHVAGVFTGDELRLYINGALAGSISFAASTLISTTDPLAISKQVGTSQDFFDGYIDEVRVYTQALAQSDVLQVISETHPCPAAPVGEWHLDEFGWNGIPGEVLDYSGNDYNGVATNVITRLGLVCSAADMVADGTTDYLTLDHNAFDGLDDFTIAVWYRGVQTGRMVIVSGARAGEIDELIFSFDNIGRFRPYLLGTASGRISAPGARDGDWHFLVWTREGANNCLYMDDLLMGCTTLPIGPVNIDPGGLIIGQEQGSLGGGLIASRGVQGDLDELLLFDSVLTAAELAQIRANNLAGLDWDGSERSCPITGAAGFVLNHDNAGINCLDEPVTVSAVDFASVLVESYVSEITLQTSTGSGNWSLLTGAGAFSDATPDDGRATYLFSGADNGSATFALNYPEGAAQVDVDVFQSDDITVRDNEAEGDLQFAPSGFTLTGSMLSNPPSAPISNPVNTQVAGVSFPLHIAAYGVTDDDPQCGVIESYAGARNLKFSMTHQNPGSGSRVAVVDGQSATTSPASATPQLVTFVAGQAQVAVNYKDVGEISLRVDDDVSFPATLSGGTNSFVVKPAGLVVSRIESSGGQPNPAAATMNSDRFVPAGQAFVVEVSALDADDEVTPNFGLEIPAESVVVSSPGLVAPAGGRHGSGDDVNNGASFSLTAAPGVLRNNSVNFDEIGIISLDPVVADGDYLGTGPVLGTNSGNVGRFYPDSFELSDELVSSACGSFSYMSQPGIRMRYRILALNTAGDLTTNYDSLDLSVATASVELLVENNDDGIDRSVRLSGAASDWDDGEYLVDTTSLSFNRLAAPDGPFEELQFALRVTDPVDPIGLMNLDVNTATSGDCTLVGDCDARAIAAAERLRYGRLLVLPAFGPEDLNLNVGLEAQSYSGGVFRTNADDSCSLYSSGRTSLATFTGNLNSGETSVLSPVPDTSLLAGGADPDAPLTLAAPGTGNTGSVELLLDVNAWLEYDWQGSGDEDPSGVATFGRYRGHDRIIFWREGR